MGEKLKEKTKPNPRNDNNVMSGHYVCSDYVGGENIVLGRQSAAGYVSRWCRMCEASSCEM